MAGRVSDHPISIHAPREGSDGGSLEQRTTSKVFQSTLPVRGATGVTVQEWISVGISIHAPREGSDLWAIFTLCHIGAFQSTLPVRGATLCSSANPSAIFDFNPRSP